MQIADWTQRLAKLTAMLGGGLERRVVGAGQARWCEEPYVGGSHSICRPGEGHRRVDIARPLGGLLFFAGEAASLGDFSTAHGAYQSGLDAVAAVRATWGAA